MPKRNKSAKHCLEKDTSVSQTLLDAANCKIQLSVLLRAFLYIPNVSSPTNCKISC